MEGKTSITFHCPLQDSNISCFWRILLLVHHLKMILSSKDPEFKATKAEQRKVCVCIGEIQNAFSVKFMNF